MKNLLQHFTERETPFYFYDLDLLRKTLTSLQSANRYGYHVHYALKANNNPEILALIRSAGMGVDCVSGNEVRIGIENGFDPQHIVLAGVGKTDREISYAIDQNIFSLNVESLQELEVINEIASQKKKRPNVSIRINPAIEVGTHHYITTGAKENKFGIAGEELLESIGWIKSLHNINFIGLHYHIGSQVTDLTRFKNLCQRVNDLQKQLLDAGLALPHLNVGGGLGINYEDPDSDPIPDFEGYFRVFHENLKLLNGQQLHFELGRAVVGQCGSIISRVLFTKASGHTTFVILDAGMTDLMRPALYQANHYLVNLSNAEDTDLRTYDVVGPVCESSDTFGKRVHMPVTKRGDIYVIRSAGAYGETMKNAYNARDLAPAYYSDDLKK